MPNALKSNATFNAEAEAEYVANKTGQFGTVLSRMGTDNHEAHGLQALSTLLPFRLFYISATYRQVSLRMPVIAMRSVIYHQI